MCLNCGCGKVEDDQGNPDNITLDDLQRASQATGQSLHETIDHMERGLDQVEAQRFGTGGMGSQGSSNPMRS
jgi:hypothetical protein